MICCCSGNKAASLDKRSRCRRPSFALAAVSCHWTCSEPRHARPHHTDQHTVSMASHVPSVSVSCRVCCRFGRTALDSRLQAAARREKNGVCQALHPFDGRLLPADLSSLTPPFFPRWLGKFDTRTDVVAKAKKKKKGERKNISQGLGIREITEMEIPSSLWAKQNPGKFGPKNDRRMKPSYMSASVWPVGGEPYVVSVFCI